MNARILLLLVVGLSHRSAEAQPATWTIDPAHSAAQFTMPNMALRRGLNGIRRCPLFEFA